MELMLRVDCRASGGTTGIAVCQPGDAAIAAGLLFRGRRDFHSAREVRKQIDERFGCDDRGREAALHVARPATIYAIAPHLAAERIDGPARAGLDHVVMRVE